MEYYSAVRRSEVLINAITWMDLKNITLHEKKVEPQTAYCVILE
jgi:hypothetical protein